MNLINKEITGMLAAQAVAENGAAAQYRAFGLWARNAGFFGCEKWLNAAGAEEITHRDRFLDYLNDMAGENTTVEGALDRSCKCDSLEDIFDAVLALEIAVSAKIHAIYAAALKANDYFTVEFLHFFLEEQLHAVRECQDIVNRLSVSGANLVEFDEWLEEK